MRKNLLLTIAALTAMSSCTTESVLASGKTDKPASLTDY